MFTTFFEFAKKYKFELMAILLWVVAFISRSVFFSNYLGDRDIYYQHLEAMRLRQGINPYERITGQDLRINEKYPTLFPFSYLLILGLSALGNYDFVVFSFLIRCLILIFELVVSLVIINVSKKRAVPLFGLAGVGFWLFSRWSLYNFAQARLDTIAISLAVLAIFFYKKNSRVFPFLIMSFSLAVKHLGVFVLPLFLFDSLREMKWGQLLQRGLLLILFPLGSALPFLLENTEGLLSSLGFSITRLPETSNIGYGWEVITEQVANFLISKLGLVGTFPGTMLFYVFPRFPLFVAFVFFMVFAYLEKWDKYTVALVGMFTFLSFNPVIFSQYFAWVVPFILLSGIHCFSRVKDSYLKNV